jgi:hypothetical protein
LPTGLTQPTCTDDPNREGVGHWKPISLDGAPTYPGVAVWTGSEVVDADVSQKYVGTIKAYDPVLDRWRDLLPPDASYLNRNLPFLGAVGGALVFYGGYRECSACTSPIQWLNDGWTIDLATGTWSPMQPGPTLMNDIAPPIPRVFGAGSKALFLLDEDGGTAAATYDLPTGTWKTDAGFAGSGGAVAGGCGHPAWNGQVAMCQWLLSDGMVTITPDPLVWMPFLALVNVPADLISLVFAPLGDTYFVLGVPNDPELDGDADYVFRVDPIAQTWSELVPVPQAGLDRRMPALLATIGSRIVSWGGAMSMHDLPDLAGEIRNDGVAFDPATGTWSSLTCVGAPAAPHAFSQIVATSSGFVVLEENYDGSGLAGSALFEL